MGWLNDKLQLLKIIVLSLRIEPFVFLFGLATNMADVTMSQLVQDKFCLNNYNQTREFCIGLQDSDDEDTVNKILADVATLWSYMTIITTLPCFFYVLNIGSWTDRYIHARKIIMCASMLGYALFYSLLILSSIYFEWNVYYLIVVHIPVTLVGGWICTWMVGYSYMTNNTPEQYRFIKFAAYQIATFTSSPTGIYLGGSLLGSGNHDGTGNLHNYEKVFSVCAGSSLGAFFWVLFSINEKRTHLSKISDVNSNEIDSDDKEPDKKPQVSDKFEFSKMFDWKNIRDIYRTSIKVRPNKGRLQIWLLILSMCLLAMSDGKIMEIVFPYTEKVYNWNAKHFSDIKSMVTIAQIVGMTLVPPFLSTYLKLKESVLGIIGVTSIFLGNVAIGSITSPVGLYLMFGLSILGGMTDPAVFALVSTLVDETESGKVFALLAALIQLFPTFQSLIYNRVFAHTIDWYPSLSFQLAAAIVFVPIYVLIWIDLKRTKKAVTKL